MSVRQHRRDETCCRQSVTFRSTVLAMTSEFTPISPESPPSTLSSQTVKPESTRLPSLDILRGVAVLGIFVMNSRNFALPLDKFDSPAHPGSGPAPTADLISWATANLLFEDKMIAVFSMLFGAGIVLAAAKNTLKPALLHYRRMFWLFLIGLLHAYGLWYGDILNTYAICGALIYPARRLRPGLVIALGIIIFLVPVWFRVEPRIAATISPPAQTAPAVESTGDKIYQLASETEAAAQNSHSYIELARWRARLNTFWHWYGCINFNFWRCGGLMLIGMGLAHLGILSASRPTQTYWSLCIGGYALGFTLVAIGFWPQLARALGRAPSMSPEARQMFGLAAWALRYIGAAAIAIGHIGAVMLLCRATSLRTILKPLAAVGRLALTNYLLQTITAVLIFDGWAFAQWGKWRMSEIAMLVVAVWVVQLIASPLYLRWFRFGPMEWAWRSLTYWRPAA